METSVEWRCFIKSWIRACEAGEIPVKIYSVVDRDSDVVTDEDREPRRHYSWDVYHIENYLLEPRFICEALKQIGIRSAEVETPAMVESCLIKIAQGQIGQLVSHKIRVQISKELIDQLLN